MASPDNDVRYLFIDHIVPSKTHAPGQTAATTTAWVGEEGAGNEVTYLVVLLLDDRVIASIEADDWSNALPSAEHVDWVRASRGNRFLTIDLRRQENHL